MHIVGVCVANIVVCPVRWCSAYSRCVCVANTSVSCEVVQYI